ncbi:hypothetical protein, partial [Azospirillum sp. sgz302134]
VAAARPRAHDGQGLLLKPDLDVGGPVLIGADIAWQRQRGSDPIAMIKVMEHAVLSGATRFPVQQTSKS